MTAQLIDHVYIFATIVLTVYGQLIMKWQSALLGPLPLTWEDRFAYLLRIVFNPWILSVLVTAFAGMLSWVIALTKFRLNYAYPFVSITFVAVLLAGTLLFKEQLSLMQIIGMTLIVGGILFISRG